MNEATVALYLLGNAIQSLATFHRAGMWKNNPAEIADNMGGANATQCCHAREELTIWQSSAPEMLCRWVSDTTGKTITRATIIQLAQEMSDSPYNRKIALHEADS